MKWIALALSMVVVLCLAVVGAVRWQLAHAERIEWVSVTAQLPGAGPQVVERELTMPLERTLSGVKGAAALQSTSSQGVAVLLLKVRSVGVDAPPAAMAVREALASVRAELPEVADEPMVQRLGAPGEVVHRRFLVSSERWTSVEVRRWAVDVARRALEQQPGVREVEVCGGKDEEVEVRVDASRLAAVGLQSLEVVDALERARGGFESLEALGKMPLKAEPAVQVRDVAQLERVGVEPSCDVRFRGRPAVMLDVTVEAAAAASVVCPAGPSEVKVEEPPSGLSTSRWRSTGELRDGVLVVRRQSEFEVSFAGSAPVPPAGVTLVANEGGSLVRVVGEDLEVDRGLAVKARALLSGAWVGEVMPLRSAAEVQVKPDRVREAQLGVSSAEVARLLQLVVAGAEVGTLVDGAQRVPVRVRLDSKPEDLNARLSNGVPLNAVVTLERVEGVSEVRRVNNRRVVEFATGLDVASVREVLKDFALPAGVVLEVGPGSAEGTPRP